ncbi:erythromycin esterase family protein [Polyangium aurulentum]|uniref:erythromycin esterase family protein n=1 Tax=Polyangium aurulentum TaxID=2567896 RepID=UPI00197D37BC|nr:erythromycin esterase family protein [Polyangium aurulentum]UQA58492.1 erythromycin esterase family protein [Polyangium aurulentum]
MIAPWLAAALLGCAGAAGQADTSARPSTEATTTAPSDNGRPSSSELAVSGVVKAPDGKPVDGALVAAVVGESGEIAARVRTSGGGRFRIVGLKPGRYGLTATAPGFAAAYHDAFDLAPGKPLEGQDLALGGKGFTLRGVVRRVNGQPASRAQVLAFRSSEFEGDTFVVETDERGAYAITLPEAEYSLGVDVPGERTSPTLVTEPRDHTLDLNLERDFPVDQPPPDEVVAWLKQNAIPLRTVEAGKGFADLVPLRDVVGKARVVSLGEATHGTREFFKLKHRLFEYLATELGFTGFAIEASMPDSRPVNEYVLTGKGDPVAVVAGMGFWTWNTEEVIDLVRWMRKYNEDPAHTRKLRFYGFDVQAPASGARVLLDDIRRLDPAYLPEATKLLAPIDSDFEASILKDLSTAEVQAIADGVERVIKHIDENKDAYEKRGGAGAHALAHLTARTIRQGIEPGPVFPDRGTRDSAMAENVRALLDIDGPGSKLVLWAHNLHVNRTREATFPRMGWLLHEALGAEHVIFGFAFGSGSFQALDMRPETGMALRSFTVGPMPPGSIDAGLSLVGHPLYALDLRRAPKGSPAASWLGAHMLTRFVGSAYPEAYPQASMTKLSWAKEYDAVLYVRETTAARPSALYKKTPRLQPAKTPTLVNPGLEEGKAGETPAGWTFWQQHGHSAELTTQRPHGGKRAAALIRDKAQVALGLGKLSQQIDAASYRGKRIRVRAFARAEVRGPGNEAAFYLDARPAAARIWTSSVAFATTRDAITTAAWKEQTLEASIPESADALEIGFVLSGSGRAFLDDVSIEVVGEAKP